MVDLIAPITALVAWYGAVLSTYTLISNRLDKRRRIKVKLSKGIMPNDADLPITMLFIRVSNPGHIPVTAQCPGIQLPNKKGTWNAIYQPSDVSFPHELNPGQACTVWTPLAVFANQLKGEGFSGEVKLVGFCKDAMGTVYKGKRWKFNVDKQFG